MNLALSQNEKQNIPRLGLHHNAYQLNSIIKETHKKTKKEKLANEVFKKEFAKLKEPIRKKVADTKTLKLILNVLSEKETNAKEISKLVGCSKAIAEDGCEFLAKYDLIKRKGNKRYANKTKE